MASCRHSCCSESAAADHCAVWRRRAQGPRDVVTTSRTRCADPNHSSASRCSRSIAGQTRPPTRFVGEGRVVSPPLPAPLAPFHGPLTRLAAPGIPLRHQLAVVHRARRPRLRLTSADRALWAWLSQAWDGWRSAVIIVKPATVITWHRRGFRLCGRVEGATVRVRRL